MSISYIYLVCFAYLSDYEFDMKMEYEIDDNPTQLRKIKNNVRNFLCVLDLNKCMHYKGLTFCPAGSDAVKIEGDIHFRMDNSIDIRLGNRRHNLKIKDVYISVGPKMLWDTLYYDTIWIWPGDERFDLLAETSDKSGPICNLESRGYYCEMSKDPDSLEMHIAFNCENDCYVSFYRDPSDFPFDMKEQDICITMPDRSFYKFPERKRR